MVKPPLTTAWDSDGPAEWEWERLELVTSSWFMIGRACSTRLA